MIQTIFRVSCDNPEHAVHLYFSLIYHRVYGKGNISAACSFYSMSKTEDLCSVFVPCATQSNIILSCTPHCPYRSVQFLPSHRCKVPLTSNSTWFHPNFCLQVFSFSSYSLTNKLLLSIEFLYLFYLIAFLSNSFLNFVIDNEIRDSVKDGALKIYSNIAVYDDQNSSHNVVGSEIYSGLGGYDANKF